MEEVHIEVTVGLDLGLCLQGQTKWVREFSMIVGVYMDGNTYLHTSLQISAISLVND
jgi:hypothetical protein